MTTTTRWAREGHVGGSGAHAAVGGFQVERAASRAARRHFRPDAARAAAKHAPTAATRASASSAATSTASSGNCAIGGDPVTAESTLTARRCSTTRGRGRSSRRAPSARSSPNSIARSTLFAACIVSEPRLKYFSSRSAGASGSAGSSTNQTINPISSATGSSISRSSACTAAAASCSRDGLSAAARRLASVEVKAPRRARRRA